MKIQKLYQRGDTIIEILLSIAVLSFVLTTSYGLANKSAQTTRQSQERSEAQKITEEQIELLRGFASIDNPWQPAWRCLFINADDKVEAEANPADCTRGIDGRYVIHITHDPSNNSYTVENNWFNVKGGQDNLKLAYKLPVTSDIETAPPPITGNPCVPAPPPGPLQRDCQRIEDIIAIHDRLDSFASAHGGKLPITEAYGEKNTGHWDYSSEGGFLTFLDPPPVPLDPQNDGMGDVFHPGLGGSENAYGYHCYDTSWPAALHNTMALGAMLEDPAAFSSNPNVISGAFWYDSGIREPGYICSSTVPSPPPPPPGPPESVTVTGSGTFKSWHLAATGGTKKQETFIFENPSSTTAINLIGTTITGDSSSFNKTADSCENTTLAADASCSITVQFAPPSGGTNNQFANSGTRNATLTVNNSNSVAATSVSLSGMTYSNTLSPDTHLARGQELKGHTSNCYNDADTCPASLVQQGSGNLVLYVSGTAVWYTCGCSNAGYYTRMQGDGNLVQYNSDWSTVVWSSLSALGIPNNSGSWLQLRGDGGLKLVHPPWPTSGSTYRWIYAP